MSNSISLVNAFTLLTVGQEQKEERKKKKLQNENYSWNGITKLSK